MFMADSSLLDKIIVGRVIPHIYAFSTNTIPNYLKVGDTYRSVDERLNEWKRYFSDLTPVFSREATVSDSVYFRDYSLHKFLTDEKGKIRLLPSSPDFPTGIYYSNEFFKDVISQELDEGIEDIADDYNKSGHKYDFYDINKRLPKPFVYARTEDFKPRPNQQETIDKFLYAIKHGRTNLLMYAVMRFGKSFTSMCCAKEMKAKCVVVVTAKADVEDEWKQTVETHKSFADYNFITSKELRRDNKIISKCLGLGQKAVVFLTLQDLCGKEIKEKHKELFGKKKFIDLLIVDETHFGARADEFGLVLKEDERDINVSDYSKEEITSSEAAEIYKHLNRKITLHLSGTPYKLLMGSEFTKEDIICFCQFSDIIQAQEKWNSEWLLKDIYDDKKCEEFGKKIGDPVREWDNPYFGFPKMIRFAFNPNSSTQQKLAELEKQGYTFAFSRLFRPKSIKKVDSNEHKQFIHEKEILDLFKAVDGSKEDSNIFPFLNYEKIQKGKMCRHMVIVLPYCASCDALEQLLIDHGSEFIHLKDYEIINISGVDNTKRYKVHEVINKIKDCELQDKKTITLTVQRMLTGSTVREWDTMIYLKDTASPQEYDQAIFRLQNQYVTSALDDKTNEVIKIDLKPQTLLVDFAPNRMFYMQEKKAQIYNANVDKSGNSKLGERIREELRISPIIVLNKDKMDIVEETNILEAISNYNMDKGISEEVLEIPIDLSVLENKSLLEVFSSEQEMNSKAGIETKAGNGNERELDVNDETSESGSNKKTNKKDSTINPDDEKIVLAKKIRNYYRRILLFAFLTKQKVISLEDIIKVIDRGENARISNNIGLSKNILKTLLGSYKDLFALSSLDYKIQDINSLSLNAALSPDDKINIAIQKFGKLGEATVVTPTKICDDIVGLYESNYLKACLNNGLKVLDIASVCGEFAVSFSKRLKSIGFSNNDISSFIFSIPKSNVCYELTRKVYEMLGLNIDCVAEKFNSYSCIQQDISLDDVAKRIRANGKFRHNDLKKESGRMIKFGAIVGNPPYNEIVEKDVKNSTASKQLFPAFIELSVKLQATFVSLITPSRWFVGGEQAGYFPKLRSFFKENNHISKLIHYPNHTEVFKDVNITGGISYFLYDINYDGNAKNTEFIIINNNVSSSEIRPLFEPGVDIVFANSQHYAIMKKITDHPAFLPFNKIIGEWNSFGIVGKKTVLLPISSDTYFDNSIRLQCAYEENRYVSEDKITKNMDIVKSWKVFTSKGNGGAGTLYDGKQVNIIGKSYLAEPLSACTDSLIPVGKFSTKAEAESVLKYMKTKFLRFMVGILKVSQNIYQNVYKLVPMQDFSSKSDIDWSLPVSDIDKQLYKKYSLTEEEAQYIEDIIKPMV